jgi:hypothetical protein
LTKRGRSGPQAISAKSAPKAESTLAREGLSSAVSSIGLLSLSFFALRKPRS